MNHIIGTAIVAITLLLSACGKGASEDARSKPRQQSDATSSVQVSHDSIEFQLAKLNDYTRSAPRPQTIESIRDDLDSLAQKLPLDKTAIADITVMALEAVQDEFDITLGPLELLQSMNDVIPDGIATNEDTYGRLLALYCGARGAGLSRDEAIVMMRDSIDMITRPADSLHDAIRDQDTARVREFLDGGADINEKDDRGMTPLHIAALLGDVEICKILIAHNADVNATEANGFSPLAMAAAADHADVVLSLLSNGADIDAQGDNGFTALHMVAGGDASMAELLVKEGANVNITGDAGITVLHLAAFAGNEAIVTLLVENGAVIQATTEGKTPIDFAAAGGHERIAALLSRHK